MRKLLFALLILLIFPATAMADGDEPFIPADIAYTQSLTIPYEFEAIEVPAGDQMDWLDLSTPDFINPVGSYAITLLEMLDGWAILGIFVVIMMAARTLWWLYHFVTDTYEKADLNITGAADLARDAEMIDESDYRRAVKIIRYF